MPSAIQQPICGLPTDQVGAKTSETKASEAPAPVSAVNAMTQQIQQHMSDNAPKEKAGKGNKKRRRRFQPKGSSNPKRNVHPQHQKQTVDPKSHLLSGLLCLSLASPWQTRHGVPMQYKEFRVYTDLAMGAWRVRQMGERKDKAAIYKVDSRGGKGSSVCLRSNYEPAMDWLPFLGVHAL